MTSEARSDAAGAPDYPMTLPLREGRSVTVRPMRAEDGDALHAFFCRIPPEDLLFLRRDVTDREVIEGWARDVGTEQTVTLFAEHDGRVVGEASIHKSRVPWSRHVGEIRVVIDAEHRQLGLGSALVQAIFTEASGHGMEKLVAEMTPDQKGAINVFQKLGFRIEGLLRDHVRDRSGTKRDMVVMSHDLETASGTLNPWGITDAVGA